MSAVISPAGQPGAGDGRDPLSWGLKLPNCGGVLCPPDWANPDTIHDLAETAERMGFDTVWFHDHLVTPAELRHLSPPFYEPLVTMTAVAAARPRLRVGVATIILPLRDPVLLAKQIGTAASFFPGRFLIGVGAGRYASEFEALGLDHFARRGSVAAEYLAIIRALLTEEDVHHSGETRALESASMNPRPVPRPPILYAGNVPAAARRAARLADGWIGASMPAPELAEMVETMRALRAEQGTDEPFVVAYSATVVRDRGGRAGTGASASRDLHQHASTLTGDGPQVGAQLAEYVAAGATHFQVSLRSDSLDELRDTMAWFASDVIVGDPLRAAAPRP